MQVWNFVEIKPRITASRKYTNHAPHTFSWNQKFRGFGNDLELRETRQLVMTSYPQEMMSHDLVTKLIQFQ